MTTEPSTDATARDDQADKDKADAAPATDSGHSDADTQTQRNSDDESPA